MAIFIILFIPGEKISGPNSPDIQTLNSNQTGVSNLVEGAYKFELTSTYWNGFTDKDTMTVTVLKDNNIYTSIKLFENLVWKANSNSKSLIIDNVSSIIPAGQPFKVYLQQDINTVWEIVAPEAVQYNSSGYVPLYYYRYSIIDNALRVNFDCDCFGDADIVSTSKIKIVY